MMTEQPLLIVDLEASCWEDGDAPTADGNQNLDVMEIIEFGCVLARRDGSLLAERSFFVRPGLHPRLSDFCTSLTSITQDDVDRAPLYAAVVPALDRWLASLPPLSAWASWGEYDRKQILADECKNGCAPAFMGYPHINLRKLWRRTTGEKRKNSMLNALMYHGMDLEGQHHRGIDDARNMAKLLPHMDWSLEPQYRRAPDG